MTDFGQMLAALIGPLLLGALVMAAAALHGTRRALDAAAPSLPPPSPAWREGDHWHVLHGDREAFSRYGITWNWLDTGEPCGLDLDRALEARASQGQALETMGRPATRPTGVRGAVSAVRGEP